MFDDLTKRGNAVWIDVFNHNEAVHNVHIFPSINAFAISHSSVSSFSLYPKVMEIKKIQMKGGTCQGEYAPTWLKQEGDSLTLALGAGLLAYGSVLCSVGFYRLATGKGKKD